MTDNNVKEVTYEQFLNFVLPRGAKITNKFIPKIRQKEIPLQDGRQKPCNYDAICALGRLFEQEIMVLKQV